MVKLNYGKHNSIEVLSLSTLREIVGGWMEALSRVRQCNRCDCATADYLHAISDVSTAVCATNIPRMDLAYDGNLWDNWNVTRR